MKSISTCSAILFALSASLAETTPSRVDFSWRGITGDFPKDKPAYLILTTEDAVCWSKVLPEFVKQKELMGFHVYVATEKDYGTGMTGNAQAAQVRKWMCGFQKRTGAKYALLIGDSSPGSANLPSPTIPDGERGGLEAAYCDLDGAWVDLYLNTKEVDTRSHWIQMCAGSRLLPKAQKEGGGRSDELITSRISYTGTEIGNGPYDLDKILEKTIRYERETVAGKCLDWRGHALSIITNYGGTNWDDPLIQSVERSGGGMTWRSNLGISGDYVPENIFDGKPANAELMQRTHHHGMVSTMSHGWNRGGEGIANQWDIFREIDDRWPASVGVAACTAFALGDNCNMGQTWLRKGGIFACGTGWSGNNGYRRQMQINQLDKRVSVGEAVHNAVVQYGDPSLFVVPPEGKPVCALVVTPAIGGHYEERTLGGDAAFKPVTRTYTLSNKSADPMQITAECNAGWVDLSTRSITLNPGDSATVEALSNPRLPQLSPGIHVADIRFRRADGQIDDRRFAVNLQPVAPNAVYTFDTMLQDNRFPDLSVAAGFDQDVNSFWLVQKTIRWRNKQITPGAKIEGLAHMAQGKVGGALRLDNPAAPFTRNLPGFTRWRGASASFWFMVDAVPPAKKSTTILAAPFALTVDSTGALLFAQGDKPVPLGTIKPGEWHFIQYRSDVVAGKARISLDGQAETELAAAKPPGEALTPGAFAGAIDEMKSWSGEISNSVAADNIANRDKTFVPAAATAPAAPHADDGVLRAPKDLPRAIDFADATTRPGIAKTLADAGLACGSLREAPEWIEFKDGVFAIKAGTDFDRIDYGGYDFFLVLQAQDGRVCEHPIKARIPVPAVNIRFTRGSDNTLAFTTAADRFGPAGRPLAKGTIRYTTNGSPVTLKSTAFTGPFPVAEGMKITARFFYLDEYPMAAITSDTEFGLPHEKWKALAVTGTATGRNGTLANAPLAFDGKSDTVWKHAGGTLPQSFAWDLGEDHDLTGISCHSTIRDPNGRIAEYAIAASDDGATWREIHTSTFASSPNAQTVRFTKPCRTRFLKIEARSLHAGTDMVITEIEAYTR